MAPLGYIYFSNASTVFKMSSDKLKCHFFLFLIAGTVIVTIINIATRTVIVNKIILAINIYIVIRVICLFYLSRFG